MSATLHHLYEFWVGEQGVPGSLLGDFLVFASTFLVGKYKVAPWLHTRHQEHLDQNERQHQEILHEHHKLYELHSKHQEQVLQIMQRGSGTAPGPEVGVAPPVGDAVPS